MKIKLKQTALVMSSMLIAGNGFAGNGKLNYPITERGDVKDVYFGETVADPYRWLENDTSAQTAEWVKAQNKVTNEYLAKIPFRQALKNKFTKISNYEKQGATFKKNGKYYFFRNSGLQNQSALYEQESLNGTPKLLLDPNALSSDGTVALRSISFSKDGKYLAYVISRSGSDWSEIYVMDVASRKLLPDHITWTKFTDATWLGDGFFYSAYDQPKDGKPLSAKNEYHKVYYHKLGEPQSEDKIEFQSKEFPLRFYSAGVSRDERFEYIFESEGDGNSVYVKDLKSQNPQFVLVNDVMKDEFSPIGNIGDNIYFITNGGASMYKLISVDIKNPARENWKTIIPETNNVLAGAQFAGDKMIVTYEKDASTHPYLYDLNGTKISEIKLPTIGEAGFNSEKDDSEVFYSFTSYTMPASVYTYDMASNTSKLFKAPTLAFNPDEFVTEQVTFKSKDGTPVKMFLTYKKGLKRNGKNPVFLYGYGGFNITLTPGYSPYRLAFVEEGGIYAVVSLRGGGEYGEEWHEAGTKMKKQNVFDDFISAAEYLVKEKYTNPSQIAINGGSNGGLLVGAVVNQRPDLFAVAVPQVGVMDMLRYHTFTIGWNWARDYGRSDDSKEMFEYLKGYSPLHTIKNDGTKYPAIMVTTADHDDRVVPAHSFKYAATLQASDTGNAPKLIRIDSKAGHGAGKPITKVIDEQTDIFSFIMYNLGMKPKK